MRVIIRKCSNPDYWYANEIGDIYEVYEEHPAEYALTNGSCVLKSDCEVIREEGVIGVDSVEKMAYLYASSQWIKGGSNDIEAAFIAGYEKGREYHAEMLEMLRDCSIQMEYLQTKFQATGTTTTVLSRLNTLITKIETK